MRGASFQLKRWRMSQEFFDEADYEEMVARWIDESAECEKCHGRGEGCPVCDGLGRIALCDLEYKRAAFQLNGEP